MCQECGRVFCANMCPNYGGRSAERGRPRGVCHGCGQSLYPNEPVHRHGRLILCEDCHRLRQSSRHGEPNTTQFQSLPFGIDL